MASVAAASAAVAAIGVWYGRRCAAPDGQISDFTEPPKTWGDSLLRMHEVVRVSWREALSKLGVWRLDHLLAIRHLSGLDLSAEIAETVKNHGVLVEVREGVWFFFSYFAGSNTPNTPNTRTNQTDGLGVEKKKRRRHPRPAASRRRHLFFFSSAEGLSV